MAKEKFNMDNHWLPFTPNRHFREHPRVFVAADGMTFTTDDGRQVLDGVSSLWCVGAGHNRRSINEAIKKQLDTLDYATAFQVCNDKAFKAAEMIAALAPGDLNKVLFCNSGSEAADTSMKVALAYHRARGEGHRSVFIGRERGYHGAGFGGMSVGGIPANRKVFSTALLPRVDHLRFIHDPVNHAFINGAEPELKEDPLLELEQRILPLHDPSNIAAVIVEPVAGSAGWYLPPKGYLKRLREICDKHGIVFINDEIQSGFGRTGKMWALEYSGVTPDLTCMAKSLAGGLPLAAVTGRADIMDAPQAGGLGGTYAGNPLACAAALAVLEVFAEERILEQAVALGHRLETELKALERDFAGVGEVRGLGAMMAIELVKSRESKAPDADSATRICAAALERGLILIKCGMHGNTLRILVPLNASVEELELGFAALRDSFEAVYNA